MAKWHRLERGLHHHQAKFRSQMEPNQRNARAASDVDPTFTESRISASFQRGMKVTADFARIQGTRATMLQPIGMLKTLTRTQ